MTKRTVSRDLAGLVSLGVFKKVGITGKGTFYVLRGQRGHRGDNGTFVGIGLLG